MNTATLLGLITGIIIGLLIYFITIKATRKYRFGNKDDFDERQKTEQGKAYKIGFFAIIIFCAIYGAADAILEKGLPIEGSAIAFMAIIVGAFSFATYAIFHDSYISINERSIRTKIILLVIGLMNIISGTGALLNGNIIEDGILTVRISTLLVGLLLLVLLAEILVKERLDKRECDEES